MDNKGCSLLKIFFERRTDVRIDTSVGLSEAPFSYRSKLAIYSEKVLKFFPALAIIDNKRRRRVCSTKYVETWI